MKHHPSPQVKIGHHHRHQLTKILIDRESGRTKSDIVLCSSSITGKTSSGSIWYHHCPTRKPTTSKALSTASSKSAAQEVRFQCPAGQTLELWLSLPRLGGLPQQRPPAKTAEENTSAMVGKDVDTAAPLADTTGDFSGTSTPSSIEQQSDSELSNSAGRSLPSSLRPTVATHKIISSARGTTVSHLISICGIVLTTTGKGISTAAVQSDTTWNTSGKTWTSRVRSINPTSMSRPDNKISGT